MYRSSLLIALAALLAAPAIAAAQVTLPVFDPEKNPSQAGLSLKGVAFEDATQPSDFRHGALLRVTLTDDANLVGTLVRVDRKNQKIYLRTETGASPRALSQKEIKKVEKATRASQDGIRPAGTKEEVIVPEIRQLVVYNGNVRTVRFTAPALSGEEQKQLRDLQDAENEVAHLDGLIARRADAVEVELGVQAARLESHHQINRLLRQQADSGFWVQFPSHSFHVVDVLHVQPELTKVLALLPSAETWGKAQENLRELRARAIYEDGRLVAVVAEEK